MSRTRVVHLGLIGLGPAWEGTYKPALEKLAGRVELEALHAVPCREARDAAKALGITHRGGLRSLLGTSWLSGVLILDPRWYSLTPLELALDPGPPLYVVLPPTIDIDRLHAVQKLASERSVFVMPELRLRYMPSTLRLRELIATDLGPLRKIEVRLRSEAHSIHDWMQAQVFDWCRNLCGAFPRQIESRVGEPQPNGRWTETVLSFPAAGGAAEGLRAVVRWPEGQSAESAAPVPSDEWPIEYSVECKYGEARIEDATHLRWRSSGQEHVESLSTDRTAAAVAFDHFARRLAGGLVPTPDLSDVLFALRLQELAARSQAEGKPISVSASVGKPASK